MKTINKNIKKLSTKLKAIKKIQDQYEMNF